MDEVKMTSAGWEKRYFAGTRGKIVTLLRRSARTVKELADTINLTQNAVRSHLMVLQRDGLVLQQAVRSGVGKPAYLYSLTPYAEQLFPKGYGLILGRLMDILAERSGPEELDDLLRTLGRRLASDYPVSVDGNARSRVEAAVNALNDLGGLALLEEADDRFDICGYVCPVAEVTFAHPEVCNAVEAMLTELAGERVYQRCQRSSSLGCRFEAPRG